MPRKPKKYRKNVKNKRKNVQNKSCEVINIKSNLKRWNFIKSQLNFKSDSDFVEHLLNIAEQELR